MDVVSRCSFFMVRCSLFILCRPQVASRQCLEKLLNRARSFSDRKVHSSHRAEVERGRTASQ
jgi:hypothetical protein